MASYLTGTETRSRLLEAAAEVFAEHGFQHARVQEICRRAKANVAAINYHFGDKQRLYMAVIEYAVDPAVVRMPHLNLDPRERPERRLRRFIEAFLSNIFDTGHPAWHGKLIAHETTNPTPGLDLVVEKMVRPLSDALRGIVGELLHLKADAELVGLCAASIMSQCVLYHYSKEIIVRLDPHGAFETRAVDRLADHITRFSLAGIRTVAASGKRGTRKNASKEGT